MSQHLIDTGRDESAVSDESRSSERRPDGATERQAPSEERKPIAYAPNGNGSGSHAERPEDRGPGRPGAQGDTTLRALDALASALAEMAKDQRLLEERLHDLHRQRAQGRSWHEILAGEEPPGTMQLVSRILACLAKASGTLRKELVDALRREGVSIPAIARLFGVTHQRVSNLLRRPAETGEPAG